MDERVALYVSLENGASLEAKDSDRGVEIVLTEVSGAAEWSSTMELPTYEARKLRDWLNENVKD